MENFIESQVDGLPKEPDTRNKLQKTAMFAVYDVLTYLDMKQDVDVEAIVSGLSGLPYQDCDYFVKAIVISTIKHLDESVRVFNSKMNRWTFDRLNRVEQAILLLSYSHFNYVDEKVDKGVVIDIAIRLSKAYLESNDYKFVNAVLDKVLIR